VNHRTGTCDPAQQGIFEPDIVHKPFDGYTLDSARTDPNEGLKYITSVSYTMDRTSEMNPFLRPGGRADTLTNSKDINACSKVGRVVNFYTYNTVCKKFSLKAVFDGLWNHEGFGSNPNRLDSTQANGHEARVRIAARDPLNDPYRIAESFVNPSFQDLIEVLHDSLLKAEDRIGRGLDGANHVWVRNNYLLKPGSTKCGEVWVSDTVQRYYRKITVTQTLPDGTTPCM